MCNHDKTIRKQYLEFINFPAWEIYQCECGALINLRDPINYKNAVYPMRKADLQRMISEIRSEIGGKVLRDLPNL